MTMAAIFLRWRSTTKDRLRGAKLGQLRQEIRGWPD
jgi:hypothetical protein